MKKPELMFQFMKVITLSGHSIQLLFPKSATVAHIASGDIIL